MTVRPDIPLRQTAPERVAFANGILLDQADFAAEQAYHRGRLAMLTRYLLGIGTIAGLEVTITAGPPVEVRIAPGLGLDRTGRIIESPSLLCLRLDRWLDERAKTVPSELGQAFRVGQGGAPDHILADVFLGFRECEVAKRPALASGAFDALGAVVPLRLRDAVEATLVLRTEDNPPLPDRGLEPVAGASPEARRAELDRRKRQDGWLEDVWWTGLGGGLVPDQEHRDGQNPADIFLARLTIPALAGTPPTRDQSALPTADNTPRRMAYGPADILALSL